MSLSGIAAPPSRSPSSLSPFAASNHPMAARLLWQWLCVGTLLTLLFPAARGNSDLIGPLSFWLLGAPVASLIVFHRQALAAAWLGVLVATPGRRRARRPGLPAPRAAFTARSVPARRRAA